MLLFLFFKVKGSLEGWPVCLVGNKCDEESGKRQVSTKTGEALEVSFSIEQFESSTEVSL